MNITSSSNLMESIPVSEENSLPEIPENWYIVAKSSDIKSDKVTTLNIGNVELALFRSRQNKTVIAFSAHCAHMGCHLKHASIEGENLRCALHFRHISPEGNFLKPNGEKSTDLVQKRYQVDERYSVVFVYLGETSDITVSVPDVLAPNDFVATYAGNFSCDTPWHGLIANGCDMEHLLSVHERSLKKEAIVTRPEPHVYKIAYNTAVTGNTLADRVMKWLSNDDINASMTVISGTTIMVQSLAGPSPTIFILSMLPMKDGGTLVHGVVGMKSTNNGLLNIIKLAITKWLFKSFLKKDFGIFDGLRWHPPENKHSSGDGFTLQLYEYFKSLKSVRVNDK